MAFFLLFILGLIIVGIFESIRYASDLTKTKPPISRTFIEKLWDRYH